MLRAAPILRYRESTYGSSKPRPLVVSILQSSALSLLCALTKRPTGRPGHVLRSGKHVMVGVSTGDAVARSSPWSMICREPIAHTDHDDGSDHAERKAEVDAEQGQKRSQGDGETYISEDPSVRMSPEQH